MEEALKLKERRIIYGHLRRAKLFLHSVHKYTHLQLVFIFYK